MAKSGEGSAYMVKRRHLPLAPYGQRKEGTAPLTIPIPYMAKGETGYMAKGGGQREARPFGLYRAVGRRLEVISDAAYCIALKEGGSPYIAPEYGKVFMPRLEGDFVFCGSHEGRRSGEARPEGVSAKEVRVKA